VLKLRNFAPLLLAVTLAGIGCRAQAPSAADAVTPGKPLSLNTSRRVEVLLRQKANLPPDSTINVGVPTASELPGYSALTITFTNEGNTSRPINFLLSADGKTMAQFTKFDISKDPRELVSAEGRPSRGGPANAPVLIVGFDDLECPYCARLHASIFPLITQRYGDKVHIVYKDFPIEQHPWAMRAAVDVNCLAAQSPTGYWDEIDYIHAHASDIGANPSDPKAEKTLASATAQLDKLTVDLGTVQKVDQTKLSACIAKQDTATIETSRKLGEALGVEATPSLFINGAKIDGAVPVEFIFNVIDDALRAQNVTPPPPYKVPTPPTQTPAATPAAKSAAPTGK
jgi:protein-disulfide isomerase